MHSASKIKSRIYHHPYAQGMGKTGMLEENGAASGMPEVYCSFTLCGSRL